MQSRLKVSGTTRGNVIGPVAKVPWNDPAQTWTLTHKQKKDLYSEANLPLPGGKCKEDHDKSPPVKMEDRVPVFYHEASPVVAEELMHALQAKSILDLSPGSGSYSMVAVRNRIPYVGVCLTTAHRDLLLRRLVSRTLESMCDSNDDLLFEPSFAHDLQQARSDQPESAPVQDSLVQPSGMQPPQPVPASSPAPASSESTPPPQPSNSAFLVLSCALAAINPEP